MTYLDPADAVATTTGRAGQHGGRVPRGADAVYFLVFTDPEHPVADRRPGWSLVGRQGDDRCWSVDLSTHGTTARSSTDEATTAADRVLDALGVRTTGWRRGTPGAAATRSASVHLRG